MPSQVDVQNALVGTWSLLEYKSALPDGGGTHYPMGQEARGIITYAPNGYMAVQLTPAVNKKCKERINDFLAYSGPYWCEKQPDGFTIVNHRAAMCSAPEFEGSIQHRVVRFADDKLILASPTFVDLEVSNLVSAIAIPLDGE